MLEPPIPLDEVERLGALHGLRLLDTPPDERFDRITRLAARIFSVPVALMTLVDTDRQWFKSKVGVPEQETPRNISFCGHAILAEETFIVRDATSDERFRDNPLVIGHPHVRFYAGHPISDSSGHRLGTICIIDVKAREFPEADALVLRDLAGLIQQEILAEKTKTTFLANMSHELRTPLNGVLGMSGLLLESGLNEDQAASARVIRDSAEGLLTVINEILEFAKIGNEVILPKRVPIDLAELIDLAVDGVRDAIKAKRLETRVQLPKNFSGLPLGDPELLGWVLSCLIGNAVKFTEKGRIGIRISARALDNGQFRIRFRVKDTGIGIPAKDIPLLFRDFGQLDSSITRSFGGPGLGLAISKRLIDGMGGRIGVESKPGRGSSFWFEMDFPCSTPHQSGFAAGKAAAEASSHMCLLPKSALGHAPEPLAATEPQCPGALAAKSKGRILLVDDNEINLRVAARMLQKLGYSIESAYNGKDAVILAGKNRYFAVLMDIQMPDMDGFEATARIRESGLKPVPPIIALTAHAMEGDREKCLAAGLDDYLSKPVRMEELRRVLSRALKGPQGPYV